MKPVNHFLPITRQAARFWLALIAIVVSSSVLKARATVLPPMSVVALEFK